MRPRLAIRYAIEGDLRFISHQDSLRFFQRATARAGIPIRYSEGFNPRPKISIAMPRPVGVASQDELLVVELTSDLDPEEFSKRLSAQLPEGIRIKSAIRLNDQDRCRPVEVEYGVALEANESDDAQRADDVRRAAETLMASPTHVVERPGPRGERARKLDIRPFLLRVDVVNDELVWSQSVSQDGTARVSEVLEGFGLSGRDWMHRVVRKRAIFRN